MYRMELRLFVTRGNLEAITFTPDARPLRQHVQRPPVIVRRKQPEWRALSQAASRAGTCYAQLRPVGALPTGHVRGLRLSRRTPTPAGLCRYAGLSWRS